MIGWVSLGNVLFCKSDINFIVYPNVIEADITPSDEIIAELEDD